MRLVGRGRDLLTPADGDPRPVALDHVTMEIDRQTITSVESRRQHRGVQALLGSSTARGARAALGAALGGETASLLRFILDDVPIVTRVGGIAWSQHERPASTGGEGSQESSAVRERIRHGPTICSGLRAGGYKDISFDRGIVWPHHFRLAGELMEPRDPWAWHEIDPAPSICFRCRRRMDVSSDGSGMFQVDAHYRDSVWGNKNTELALHEYSMRAAVVAATGTLHSISVEPRVLPFPECPTVSKHASILEGSLVIDFSTSVGRRLRGLECCTHLNDMLRGLVEVPGLTKFLE